MKPAASVAVAGERDQKPRKTLSSFYQVLSILYVFPSLPFMPLAVYKVANQNSFMRVHSVKEILYWNVFNFSPRLPDFFTGLC
ncbi:hypothetical protein [Candidatus Hecatella orcuttiae]|uniref:hypothetical protein n=1 Tax=Candidatus Hecatella orcuttiae TaxID=1935119 RepID=UPI00286810C4|nr:hypothetical protein [Candidatus Hecatella orcuttiae]